MIVVISRKLWVGAALAVCAMLFFGSFFVTASIDEHPKSLTVVIDAGHGGMDGGSIGTISKAKESDINLAISYELKRQLENVGIKVVMTRQDKGGLYGLALTGRKKRDMNARKKIVENSNCDMLISVHCNKFFDPSVRGAQVFFNAAVQASKMLAHNIQQYLNSGVEPYKPRVALRGDYFMLEILPLPCVIVECGYLSNAADEQLLQQKTHQSKLAESILMGIMSYLAENSQAINEH